MDKLGKCEANSAPLTPLTFLKRAATSYAARTSIIYKNTSFNWYQTYDRCCRLVSSLRSLNISKNDVVSVLAPNIPALYEMHFAVPMAAAVLNTINTCLDANEVYAILAHADSKLLFVDHQLLPIARDALASLGAKRPLLVVIDELGSPRRVPLAEFEYEQLVRNGDPDEVPHAVDDEWDPIALNYTSGTPTPTAPKGVVYTHRGAYLSTLSLLLQWEVGSQPIYLWSLPMFHCNGWSLAWGIAARGGTNVCIRGTSVGEMYSAIYEHRVTHMCCTPVLFNVLLQGERRPLTFPVRVLTGGAPPPAALLEKIQRLGFRVMHAYGMTEATGVALVCEWQAGWDHLPAGQQALIKARQGISAVSLADVDVKDPTTMQRVPRDGQTVGEIVIRGSTVMKGYYKDPGTTALAFEGGWYHTGDAAVVHPDGYIEVTDRLKDVIVSGGGNYMISSVQLESVLYSHPMVAEAAVVAMPRGETRPCAFISLKKGKMIREEDMISYCREELPHFMVPRRVVFMAEGLPKINMKIQKFKLRELARTLLPPRPRNGDLIIHKSHNSKIIIRSSV